MKGLYLFFLCFFSLIIIQSPLLTQTIEGKNQKVINGFGDIKWGIKVQDAKEKVHGKIVYFDEKKVIITKDGDIKYLYGFFCLESRSVLVNKEEKEIKKEEKSTSSEASLFYVSVQFPYLSMQDVRKKIEEKYGSSTGENVKDNQGAIFWSFDKTTIIMWIERYNNKPFCRKINYLGNDLAKKINEYQRKIFNKAEMEILNKLSL